MNFAGLPNVGKPSEQLSSKGGNTTGKGSPSLSDKERSLQNIDAYIAQYSKEYSIFQAAATEIEQQIRQYLAKTGKPAIVSSRAKDPYRLKVKLQDRVNSAKSPKTYLQVGDIETDIVDIVGTRVVMYMSHQTTATANGLMELFRDPKKPGDLKPITDKDLSSNQLMIKLWDQKVMHALDQGLPSRYTPLEEAYQPQLGSYRAKHLRLALPSSKFTNSQIKDLGNDKAVKVEIQVQGLLMHAWSEVSHDILYKPLAGELSQEEYILLDCLNGIGKLGEFVLKKLEDMSKARVDLVLRAAQESSSAGYVRQSMNLDQGEVVDEVCEV